MNLNGIPGYAIRSYLALLNMVRHSDHPSLAVIILRELAQRNLIGKELLTPEVVEFLGTHPVNVLWKRITFCDKAIPVAPCPDAEKKPYDDGSTKVA